MRHNLFRIRISQTKPKASPNVNIWYVTYPSLLRVKQVKTNPELLKSDSSFGRFMNSSFFTSKSIIFFSSLSFFIWSCFWNSRFSRIRLRDSTYIIEKKQYVRKFTWNSESGRNAFSIWSRIASSSSFNLFSANYGFQFNVG